MSRHSARPATAPAVEAATEAATSLVCAAVLLLTCVLRPALAAVGADNPTLAVPLTRSITRELDDGGRHHYVLPTGRHLLVVENLGRATILIAAETNGQHLLRAANWRGSEGRYTALISARDSIEITILPDEAVAPPGSYRISATRINREDSTYAAEQAMTLGADAMLSHYFGEADRRVNALTHFSQAAAAFGAMGDVARQADAVFEAAGVAFNLGEHEKADELYERADRLWSSLRDQRGSAAALQQRGLIAWRTNRPALAIDYFRRVTAMRQTLGDDYFYAQALNNLGLVYRDLGDSRHAIDQFSQALAIWQGDIDLLAVDPAGVDFSSVGRPPWLLDSLIAINNMSWATELLGDTARTEQLLQQGLALSRFLGRGRMAAEMMSNLGRLQYQVGDLEAALVSLGESLRYFKSEAIDEIWAANIHQSQADVYRAAGDNVRAMVELEESLRLRTAERDPVSRAETLLALADLVLVLEAQNSPDIDRFIEETLVLLGDEETASHLRARSLDLKARALAGIGEFDSAIDIHESAIQLYSAAGDRRGEAVARANRAATFAFRGEYPPAHVDLSTAMTLARQVEDRLLQFRILTADARLNATSGDTATASKLAQSALDQSEALRDALRDPTLLRYFGAIQRDMYDVLIHVALAEDRIVDAWELADRARARRLHDQLRNSGDRYSGFSPTQRQMYESLVHQRAARTTELTRVLSGNRVGEERADTALIRSELAAIVSEIDRLRAAANEPTTSGYRVASISAIQNQLAPGEVVLEFYLGDLVSGVWQVDAANIAFHALSSADIEHPLRIVVGGLRHQSAYAADEMRQLSEQLLGRLKSVLMDARHLVVVPDGPLYFLPFSTLPDPANEFERPLVDRLTVSYLPSITALLEIKSRPELSTSGIAVLADPVFDAADSRVQIKTNDGIQFVPAPFDILLERGANRLGIDSFQRLPGTQAEAEAIRRAAGDIDVFVATGTRADRRLVMSGALRDYAILHFATHGVLDAEEPALSALVLSAVDFDGKSQSPFLRAQDVATLDLRARLVVLSGCDTGSGRVAQGEGLVGLSQAFFNAGASQVISTLWAVPDRAAAELMEHFYRELLENDLSPVTALQRAKLALRSNWRWHDPYYWAPFIVQGDWR